eukprot:COSAG02_NODE_1076_length_14725_cov_10.610215_5_plen_59_part_00
MVTTWDVPTGPAEGPDEEDESGSKLPKRDEHDASGERLTQLHTYCSFCAVAPSLQAEL